MFIELPAQHMKTTSTEHGQNMARTCSEHVLLMFCTCGIHVLNWQFHEQSVVILWVNWCKNKSFWQRFTFTGEKIFDCKECTDVAFTSYEQLRTHTKKVHKGIRFICDMCRKEFSTSAVKSTHMRKVHGVRMSEMKKIDSKPQDIWSFITKKKNWRLELATY